MEMDANSAKHTERDTLYLEASEGTSRVTLPSIVAIFIQQYCRYHDIDIILVSESEPSSDERCRVSKSEEVQAGAPSQGHPGIDHEGNIRSEESFSSNSNSHSLCRNDAGQSLTIPKHLEYTVLKADCLPRVAQDCQLPCILLPGRQLCVSGLANVLRHIILSAVPLEPHRNLIALLGFKQTSLKCCSESSIWTKLCEVDTPQQVTDFLLNPSAVPSNLICLRKFEELLAQPVATFNSEKLRRKLLKNQEKDGNVSQGGKGSKEEVEESDGTRHHDDRKHIVVAGKETGTKCNGTQIPEDDLGAPYKKSINNGVEELTSEFSQKVNVCNKQDTILVGKENEGEHSTKRTKKPLDDEGSLDKQNVAGIGEELTSEFSHEVHLCNKKEERRRKREQRKNKVQSSQDLSSTDGTVDVKVEQVCLPNGSVDGDGKDGNSEMVSAPDGSRRRRRKKPRNKKTVHKDSLPELTHLFAEGVDVTLTDFALFVPVHLWLHTSSLNGTFHLATQTVPLVIEWYQRMWDVPCVRQVMSTCLGMRRVDVLSLMEGSVCHDSVAMKENSKTDSFLCEEDALPHVGNLNVGRAVVRELLKKVLPGVIRTLEGQGLSGSFMDHPSKDTSLDWRNMPAAVSPIEGDVEARRAKGKEQQIESIVTAVQKIALPGQRILDFCSGGGHLGIALAYCLPECHVIMIENKEESLRRALSRVQTLGLWNVSLYLSNIDYFCGQFDIGVSLHACGVATDIVLSKCLERKASFVSSPCCYGTMRSTHHISYPRSRVFKESSISKKEYFLVGRGAEQTCWDFESPLAKQGKQCMGFIDRDRAEFAGEHGYHVTLCSLQPETCSPKNNLLIGVSPRSQDIRT